MARKRLTQHSCANCGFEFSADSEHTNYCPNCGQENHNPRFPLIHYFYELLEGLLHFDTKFLHSLRILLSSPGQITYDFINNIRGRYTPPFKLFIFISIFALIVIGIFEKNLAESGYFGAFPKEAIEKNLTIGEMFDQSADSTKDQILVPPFSWIMSNPQISNFELRELKRTSSDSIGFWLVKNGIDNNFLSRFFALNKKKRVSRQMTIPEVAQMVSGIYKWLFLVMIPVYAFVLFVIFYKRQLFYYDTLIYSIHFLSFFLLLFSIMLLTVMWLSRVDLLLLIIILWIYLILLLLYLSISLKKVFAFTWMGTLARMLLSCLISFAVFQLIHFAISLNSGR